MCMCVWKKGRGLDVVFVAGDDHHWRAHLLSRWERGVSEAEDRKRRQLRVVLPGVVVPVDAADARGEPAPVVGSGVDCETGWL